MTLDPSADYHHSVLVRLVPSGDFTKWCTTRHSSRMNGDIDQRRRELLEAYAKEQCGSLNAFAAKIKKSQTQLNGTIRGKKSFGEKLARDLERRVRVAGLPPIGLPVAQDAGNAAEAADSGNMSLTRLQADLLTAFAGLTPKRRKELVGDLAIEVMNNFKGAQKQRRKTRSSNENSGDLANEKISR